jgi:hypothetical protein
MANIQQYAARGVWDQPAYLAGRQGDGRRNDPLYRATTAMQRMPGDFKAQALAARSWPSSGGQVTSVAVTWDRQFESAFRHVAERQRRDRGIACSTG